MPPQFDHSGQFTAFLEHLTDGRGCRFVDAEHAGSMSGHGATDKKNPTAAAPVPPIHRLPLRDGLAGAVGVGPFIIVRRYS
jgi:hypothetical protein